MNYLDLVKLTKLMELTKGKSCIKIGLIDGPVVTSHPDLESENIQEVPGREGMCGRLLQRCLRGSLLL